jgi:hypothetical protein
MRSLAGGSASIAVTTAVAAAEAVVASMITRSTDPHGFESQPEIIKFNGYDTAFDIYISKCFCIRIKILCLIVDVKIRKKILTACLSPFIVQSVCDEITSSYVHYFIRVEMSTN